MEFRISSLYICVRDMERAIKFYERLLNKTVTEHDDVYSVFDIKGFRFGLFANEKVNERHIYGDNCLPSFEVDDIKLVQERLLSLNCPIVFPLTNIKNNWVLEFVDSEGNHIEITSPNK
ncbi:VOC family protein [Clostridium sp.]|uniref:VOC family protein n=1 Tax=Clostridium sp. TaxID=1506 RepID=UPI003D6CD0E0